MTGRVEVAPPEMEEVAGPSYHYLRTLRYFAERDPSRIVVSSPSGDLRAADLVDQAERLGAALGAHGITRGTPVALMMSNRVEVVVSFFAGLVVGAPPTNVNPRYTAAEVAYILNDCAAGAIFYESAHKAVIRAAVESLDREIWMVEVGGQGWTDALAAEPARGREPDPGDRLLIYTGGTTGMPRAVEWRIDDHYQMIWGMVKPKSAPPTPESTALRQRHAPTALPCSPILHGVGLSLMLNTLNGAGRVVLTGQSSFDAAQVFSLAEKESVEVIGIVGDAFARPLLVELETGAWTGRLTSLRAISSAGAPWSNSIRDRMQELLPDVRLISNFGSTEALVARDMQNGVPFKPDGTMIVIGDDGLLTPVGEVGVLATAGFLPVGYLGDPEKTAATFKVIDGRRYAITGDQARVEGDGYVTLLGRGTSVINTGGEKVWPEEVESVLLRRPEITDAVVVGRADERWGQRVTAIYTLAQGSTTDEAALIAACRAELAAYKCPKEWIRLQQIPRTTVGKPDYAAIRTLLGEK